MALMNQYSLLEFGTSIPNDDNFAFVEAGAIPKTTIVIRDTEIYAGQIVYFKYTDE